MMNNPRLSLKPIIFGSIAVLLIVSIVLFVSSGTKKALKESIPVIATPSMSPHPTAEAPQLTDGNLTLFVQGHDQVFLPGEEVTLIVEGNSSGQSIEGFDVTIPYDPSLVTYKSAESMLPAFSTVPTNHNGVVVVSGIKAVADKSESVLLATQLLRITFVAKQIGSFTFEPQYIPNSRKDSNLFNANTQDILGSVKGTSVHVGALVVLPSETAITLGDTGLTARATESTVIPPNCADCMETAAIEVQKGTDKKTLNYKFGGFAGFMTAPQEAFGYMFSMHRIKKAGVDVIYYPVTR